MTPHLVIIPGLGDSGTNHWQSYWLENYPHSTKLIQDNWDQPKLNLWLYRLDEKIKKLKEPTIVVAHSLAVVLFLHWLTKNSNKNIIGALLVAPADVDSEQHTPNFLRHFSPIPLQKITIPSIVVSSENDPYILLERARELAALWGSDFINIGHKGHINSDSNLGNWEEGQKLLEQLIEKTRS